MLPLTAEYEVDILNELPLNPRAFNKSVRLITSTLHLAPSPLKATNSPVS